MECGQFDFLHFFVSVCIGFDSKKTGNFRFSRGMAGEVFIQSGYKFRFRCWYAEEIPA